MKEMWPEGRLRASSQGPAVDADFRLRLTTIAFTRGLLGVALITNGLQVALVIIVHAGTIEGDHRIGTCCSFVDDMVDSIGGRGARAAEAGLAEV